MSDASLRAPEYSTLPGVRMFGGCSRDLDQAIDSRDRVETAVRLVAGYSEGEGGEEWAWSLPIGMRVLQLLKVVQDSQEESDLLCFQQCPQVDCGEKLELSLPLAALISHGEEAHAQGEELNWEQKVSFRRATGRDQLNWRSDRFSSLKDVQRSLLEALVVEGKEQLETLDEAALSEAMVEFDPLVSFRLATECPACRKESLIALDIEQLCLSRIKQIQIGLFKSVHRLAKAYGWTEGEILGLSPKRRAFYLECLEQEELAL